MLAGQYGRSLVIYGCRQQQFNKFSEMTPRRLLKKIAAS